MRTYGKYTRLAALDRSGPGRAVVNGEQPVKGGHLPYFCRKSSFMILRRYASLLLVMLLNVSLFANWTATGLANSGHRSMTTHNGALFLATYNTGIQKSTDGGLNWTLANTGLPLTSGQVKVQSVGHNATTMFCGTESGLYRSTDNGASWVLAQSGLSASSATVYVNKIYTFNGVTFVLYSGNVGASSGGLFRTTDNGVSWLQAYNGLQINMTVYNIAQASGNVLYASTNTGLMRSTDLGQQWSQVTGVNYAVYSIEATPTRLVALTTFGARYSVDGGTTWLNSTNYPVANPTAGSELISYDSKFYAITESGSLGCVRSLDGGITWEAYNTGLSAPNTFAQEEFHASGNELFIICALDVYSTAGSTVGLAQGAPGSMPHPFPTAFDEGFYIDLSSLAAGSTLLLMDASGREMLRRSNLPATMVRFDRDGLSAGLYHCLLLDPRTGSLNTLGSVIAQ